MEKIRKPRVLLTGFTPFGGETVNPALEAVKRVRCPVPVKDMVRAIQEAGVPSELSNSAGTYVCNHLLYCVLHHAGPGVRAGFIHVPCIPEQTEGTDRPSLPLAQLVTALEAAVSACCKG